MKRRRAPLALVLGLTACFDAGPFIGPGRLTVSLESPHGDEGAAVLLLVGEGILGLDPAGETEVHASSLSGESRVVLIHPDGGVLAFEMTLADLSSPPVPVIVEVAGPDDELRVDLDGYRVELAR